jgi:hypothetical protein
MKKRFLKGVSAAMAIFLLTITPAMSQDNKNHVLLETIGVLSAHGIYLTYSSIGALADGHSNKTYDDNFTVQMLTEYNNISDNAIKQLKKLLSSGVLESSDVVFVNRLVETHELLKAEADGYRNYVRTKQTDHLKVYSEKRNAAWKNISELLGLDKK